MRQVEVFCPVGAGRGTQVLVDGMLVDGITNLTIDIPADGVATVTIRKVELEDGDDNKVKLTPDRDEIQRAVVVFRGSDFYEALASSRQFTSEQVSEHQTPLNVSFKLAHLQLLRTIETIEHKIETRLSGSEKQSITNAASDLRRVWLGLSTQFPDFK